jgi:hypothetical protein
MPKLTYEIPHSKWALLVDRARREGVSPRTLVLWDLRESLAKAAETPQPTPEPAAEQAA